MTYADIRNAKKVGLDISGKAVFLLNGELFVQVMVRFKKLGSAAEAPSLGLPEQVVANIRTITEAP